MEWVKIDGICLLLGVPRVELYGDIFIEKAGKDGIAFDGSNNEVTAYCSLTLFDNVEGISFDISQTRVVSHLNRSPSQRLLLVTLRALALVVFVRDGGAHVQCDKVATAGSFDCEEDCVILPSYPKNCETSMTHCETSMTQVGHWKCDSGAGP